MEVAKLRRTIGRVVARLEMAITGRRKSIVEQWVLFVEYQRAHLPLELDLKIALVWIQRTFGGVGISILSVPST